MELKCVIVDDEKSCRDQLRAGLAAHCPRLIIAAEAPSIDQAEKLITAMTPDLVFLDIHLADGSGFDLLDRIKDRTFQVIFVTAFDSYAIKAFELNALDYLLKPIQPSQLMLINQKIAWFREMFKRSSRTAGEYLENRQAVLGQLKQGRQAEQLVIMHNKGMNLVRFEDITYLEASGSYTFIHKADNERITASRGLRSFEKLLDPELFFRIHKSTIINIHHVQGYFFDSTGYVLLSNGARREVSRRKKQPLFDFMKERNVVS